MSGSIEQKILTEEEMQEVYAWVDEIPLTRPKRNISRDFSDGVMAAELIKHFFPKIVELHNYSTANSVTHKLYNWSTLNQKVFKKLNFTLSRNDIDSICYCNPGYVERVLHLLKNRIEARIQQKAEKKAASEFVQQIPHIPMAPPLVITSNVNNNNTSPQTTAKVHHLPQPQHQQQIPQNGGMMSPNISAPKVATHKQSPHPLHPPSPRITHPLPSHSNQPPPQPSPQQQHTPTNSNSNLHNNVFHENSRPSGIDPQFAALSEKKDQTISELHAHVENLESRLMKLEQIVRIRDSKIQKLTARLQQAGLS